MEPNVPQSNPVNSNPVQVPEAPHRKYQVIISVLGVLIVLLILASLWLVRQNRKNQTTNNATTVNNVVNTVNSTNTSTNTSNTNSESNTTTSNTTGTQNTTSTQNNNNNSTTNSGTPQVVSSSPANGASVAESSVSSVSVTFDRALNTSSLLSVTKESLPYHVGTGVTTFSGDKKTMTLSINSNSNSVYTIHYTACTGTNTNCATGNITFTVGTGGKVPAADMTR